MPTGGARYEPLVDEKKRTGGVCPSTHSVECVFPVFDRCLIVFHRRLLAFVPKLGLSSG